MTQGYSGYTKWWTVEKDGKVYGDNADRIEAMREATAEMDMERAQLELEAAQRKARECMTQAEIGSVVAETKPRQLAGDLYRGGRPLY